MYSFSQLVPSTNQHLVVEDSLWPNRRIRSDTEWNQFKESRSERRDLPHQKMRVLWPRLKWREQSSRFWQSCRHTISSKRWREIRSALFQWTSLLRTSIILIMEDFNQAIKRTISTLLKYWKLPNKKEVSLTKKLKVNWHHQNQKTTMKKTHLISAWMRRMKCLVTKAPAKEQRKVRLEMVSKVLDHFLSHKRWRKKKKHSTKDKMLHPSLQWLRENKKLSINKQQLQPRNQQMPQQKTLKKETNCNGKTSSSRRKWWVNPKPFLKVSFISLWMKPSTRMAIRLRSQAHGRKGFSMCSRCRWLIRSISLCQIHWVREMIITIQ